MRGVQDRLEVACQVSARVGHVICHRWEAREFKTREGITALSKYVFHAGDGRAIVDFKRSWTTACAKAGVPGKLFHDLRRSAVRNMIRAGVPQSVALRISGHTTAAIFTRYDITSDDDERAALRATQSYVDAQPATATVVRCVAAGTDVLPGGPAHFPHKLHRNAAETTRGLFRGPDVSA